MSREHLRPPVTACRTRGDLLHDEETELTSFTLRGARWIAERWLDAPLREVIIPNLDRPESAGAERIKRTTTRSVYRLELDGRAVFIKRHRAGSLGNRFKYLLLPSRASAEWRASRALAERGIPAARAVAFGERRVAGVLTDAVLISAEVENAHPLGQVIADELGAVATGEAFRGKRALLRRVAHLVRATHDRGALHRDLHGGNILVSGDELLLIDLHRVSVGVTVSRRRRAANVAQLLAYLGNRVTAGDRLAFIREYLGAGADSAEVDAFARAAGRGVVALRERRYTSRTKRCVKRSTGFRRERASGFSLYRRTDFPADQVCRVIREHQSKTAGGKSSDVLKSDLRTRVTLVEAAGEPGAPARCVKEFIRPGALRRLGDWIRGSPARLAWLGANGCLARGIPTPRPLAMAEAGRRSFFITEYVDGAVRFSDYVARHGHPTGAGAVRRWRRFIREAADLVRRLHSHRLRHLDLSGKNLLVRELEDGWELCLVDVSDIRFGRAPDLPFRIRNLGQLDDVYVKPSRTDRLRFYRHYARGLPELNRREFLAEIDAISRARHEHWLQSDEARRFFESQGQDPPA